MTAQAQASVPVPTLVTQSALAEGKQQVDVGSVGYRSTVLIGEAQEREFHGAPPQHEDDVLDVCAVLRTVLNENGGSWGRFALPEGSTDDVDATAADDTGERLYVQVTRVERAVWQTLAKTGQATQTLVAKEVVSGVRIAIESKAAKHSPAQRRELLLALDAKRSPGYADPSIATEFVAQHGAWAESLGYRAIWLVGPVPDLTHRLDTPGT